MGNGALPHGLATAPILDSTIASNRCNAQTWELSEEQRTCRELVGRIKDVNDPELPIGSHFCCDAQQGAFDLETEATAVHRAARQRGGTNEAACRTRAAQATFYPC
jgi:hypothetical protein